MHAAMCSPHVRSVLCTESSQGNDDRLLRPPRHLHLLLCAHPVRVLRGAARGVFVAHGDLHDISQRVLLFQDVLSCAADSGHGSAGIAWVGIVVEDRLGQQVCLSLCSVCVCV